MRSTKHGPPNPLECPSCNDYRYLCIEGVRFEKDDKKIGIKIPFYKCLNCDSLSPIAIASKPIYDDNEAAQNYYKQKADAHFLEMEPFEIAQLKQPFEEQKFEKYHDLGFKYDSRDYYYIPGLFRDWNEGFLCPVFFTRDLLLYYNNHNDYRVVFSSYSRLHILDKNDIPLIDHGFGINRNGHIICWLGDLHEEFMKAENEKHKKIFYAFNIDSDHDIVSDYYIGQIEADFIDSDNERKVFSLRNDFDSKIIQLTEIEITQFNLDDFVDEYKHPIINELDQINSAYIKLNSILIESFDVKSLKQLLLNKGIDPKELKDLRGLKLFERFLGSFLDYKDASKVVMPLYVLYDLRVLAGHVKDSNYDDKLLSCKDRLGIGPSAKNLEVFDALIENLVSMYTTLLKRI